MFKFQMGVTVRDLVSGFEGIITGRAEHITNCDTYGVTPPAQGGDFKKVEWFDEPRLELVSGKPALTLVSGVGAPAEKTGAGENPERTNSVG